MKYGFVFFSVCLFVVSCKHKNVHTSSVRKDDVSKVTSGVAGYERYILRPQLIQKLPNGEDLNWGGFSGLRFIEKESTGDLLFWTITDRGPNGEEFKKNGWSYRGFLVPHFHPSLVKLRSNKAEKYLEVIESIPLKNNTGEFLTGLPPQNSEQSDTKYEVAVDTNNERIFNRTLGIDSESLAVDEKNHFWVGEEYEPSILEFDPQGTLLAHIQPALKPNTKLKKNEIPYEYRLRKSNRGFEALAYFKNKIYFMTQSPLGYESKPQFIRIGVFNTKTRKYEAEYLYPLENSKIDKIGDMQMIDEMNFLVIEQNGQVGHESTHLVYQVDLTKATNRLTKNLKKVPEAMSSRELSRQINPARKFLMIDLVKEGYADFEKVEGLAIVDSNTIAVINDNDFGVDGAKIILRPTVLGLFKVKN